MFEVIKKAWEETFYPQIISQDGQTTFFDGREHRSFLYYFLEYPLPESRMAFKLLYFIGLGFILFPLKNLVKAGIEFPIILMCLGLEKLKSSLSFIPRVDLVFFVPSVILYSLRYWVGLILSPAFSQYRILSLINNIPSATLLYFFSSIVAVIVFRNTLTPVLLNAFQRRFPNFFETGWPLLRWLSIVHSAFSSMNVQANNIPPEKNEDKRSEFLVFADFDPNTTRCSISGKLLGFTKEEPDTLDMVVIQYKEEDIIKYALLKALLPSAYHTAPLSMKDDLIAHLKATDPSRSYTQVPPHLTRKFDESLQCPILLVALTEDLNPVRTIYGHYYSEDGIRDWVNRKGTCPISRFQLKPEDLKEVPMIEREQGVPDREDAPVVEHRPSRLGGISSWLDRVYTVRDRNSFFRPEEHLAMDSFPSRLSSRHP